MGVVVSVCAEERKVEDLDDQSKKEKNEAQGNEALQKDKKNFKEVKISINLNLSSDSENSGRKLSGDFLAKMEQLEQDSNSQDSDSEYKVLNKLPSGNSQNSKKSNKKKQKPKKEKATKKKSKGTSSGKSNRSKQNYSQNEFFESVQENKKQPQTKVFYNENQQFGQDPQEKQSEFYAQQIDFETVFQNQIDPQSNNMQNEQVIFSNQYQSENDFKFQTQQAKAMYYEAEKNKNKKGQQQQFQSQQNVNQDLNKNSNLQQANQNNSQSQKEYSEQEDFDEDEVINQSQKLNQREIGYQKHQDQIIIVGIEKQDSNKMKKQKQAQMLEQNFAPAIQYEYSEDQLEKKMQYQKKQFKSESFNSEDNFQGQYSSRSYKKGKTDGQEENAFTKVHDRYTYNNQKSPKLPQRNTYISPLDMDLVKKQVIQNNLQHNIMGELHNQVYDTVTPLLVAEKQIELGDGVLFYRPSLDIENYEAQEAAENKADSPQIDKAFIEDQQNQLKEKREQFEQMFKNYESKVQSFLESKQLKIDLQKD